MANENYAPIFMLAFVFKNMQGTSQSGLKYQKEKNKKYVKPLSRVLLTGTRRQTLHQIG